MRKLLIIAFAVLLLAPAAALAAGGQFTDDDTSVFEDDIEWLAGAAITGGCNPPDNDNYCPGKAVTRGQMAAFMRRFAGYLGAEDGIVSEADHAAEADNADTVDGYDASGLVRAAGTNDGSVDDWDGSTDLTMTTSIDAPSAGFLLITFNASLGEDIDSTGTGLGDGVMVIEIDGVQEGAVTWWSFEFGDAFARDHATSMQRLVPVDAGIYAIDGVISTGSLSATEMVFVYESSLTVLFVPFDGTGAVPLPASAPATSDAPQQKQS